MGNPARPLPGRPGRSIGGLRLGDFLRPSFYLANVLARRPAIRPCWLACNQVLLTARRTAWWGRGSWSSASGRPSPTSGGATGACNHGRPHPGVEPADVRRTAPAARPDEDTPVRDHALPVTLHGRGRAVHLGVSREAWRLGWGLRLGTVALTLGPRVRHRDGRRARLSGQSGSMGHGRALPRRGPRDRQQPPTRRARAGSRALVVGAAGSPVSVAAEPVVPVVSIRRERSGHRNSSIWSTGCVPTVSSSTTTCAATCWTSLIRCSSNSGPSSTHARHRVTELNDPTYLDIEVYAIVQPSRPRCPGTPP